MGYKGEATIDFTVERNGFEVELRITGSASYTPGRLSGPPEDCYPSESDAEVVKIVRADSDAAWDGELTENEEELVIEKLHEAVMEDEPADPPDEDDED